MAQEKEEWRGSLYCIQRRKSSSGREDEIGNSDQSDEGGKIGANFNIFSKLSFLSFCFRKTKRIKRNKKGTKRRSLGRIKDNLRKHGKSLSWKEKKKYMFLCKWWEMFEKATTNTEKY